MGAVARGVQSGDGRVSAPTSADPEDRRRHLDYIQATITRMSSASTTTKSWMMPVVTATYGYALTQLAVSVAVLGIGSVVLFAYLDANYLRAERRFRCLYEAVVEARPGILAYSLNPFDAALDPDGRFDDDWSQRVPRWINRFVPGPKVWASWAIGPFYAALIALGVFIGAWAAVRG